MEGEGPGRGRDEVGGLEGREEVVGEVLEGGEGGGEGVEGGGGLGGGVGG